LPFADSFFYRNNDDLKQLKLFIKNTGFPIVVKPKIGYGSRGVFFIINNEHLETILHEKDLLFQEFLGHKKEFENYYGLLKRGIPLYFDIPGENQCAGQTIISGKGNNGRIFCSIVGMVRGYPVTSVRLRDEKAELIVKECAKAMYKAGWYGFLNVQMKRNKGGHWKIFEFNPRMTGSTSARNLLGYDELGTYTDLFKPEFKIPNYSDSDSTKFEGKVYREMIDYFVPDTKVADLKKNRVWEQKK
jgi:carbamoyl-phosphate synthase large subunit